MSISQAAPSPFAVLLRRSKFVTYDPQIGQVYTTYGGHAHRGNWGFKRPLPNRRPTGYIYVRAVDTPEQQTEWDSAESSGRWIKRWDEMGKDLRMDAMALWQATNAFDSDFARPRDEQEGLSLRDVTGWDASELVPRPYNMKPKQFQKYVERVRKLRPEFKRFLLEEEARKREEQAQSGEKLLRSQRSQIKLAGDGEVDMYTSAQTHVVRYVNSFLAEHAKQELLEKSNSTKIGPQPHRTAGLEYTTMNQAQVRYLSKPLPGRVIQGTDDVSAERKTVLLAAVGGLLGKLPEGKAQEGYVIAPTEFGKQENPRVDSKRGESKFRMTSVSLYSPPNVVGPKPGTVKDAEWSIIAFGDTKLETANVENPYPPGTAAYVAAKPLSQTSQNQMRGKAIGSLVKQLNDAKKVPRRPQKESNINTVGALEDILAQHLKGWK
ncbi:hypothetical protein M422DRAFT_47404 [Sphaerobolus stellatus SS14]|uniref:Uncharacterized protein n=1 Tax=Sphaerobolus stellatus (strain SS14) TaxID=990650 RepID=A0A0C9UMU6_SPHS4|nr:hypothetical protein M422DRAFT_47404 [Sphaerobolus stellatus SS14]